MCNDDWNIDHTKWSEKDVSSLEGTKFIKHKSFFHFAMKYLKIGFNDILPSPTHGSLHQFFMVWSQGMSTTGWGARSLGSSRSMIYLCHLAPNPLCDFGWTSMHTCTPNVNSIQTTPTIFTMILVFKFEFEQSSYLFSLKNSRPCQDLNLGPPRYQADMLPIDLFWLGSVWGLCIGFIA